MKNFFLILLIIIFNILTSDEKTVKSAFSKITVFINPVFQVNTITQEPPILVGFTESDFKITNIGDLYLSLKELTKTKEGTKYFNDLLAKGDFFKKKQFLISKLTAEKLIERELFSPHSIIKPGFKIFLEKPFYSGQELAAIINRNL
jgi:hypothetical protein